MIFSRGEHDIWDSTFVSGVFWAHLYKPAFIKKIYTWLFGLVLVSADMISVNKTVAADFKNGLQKETGLLDLENKIGFRRTQFNYIVWKLYRVLKWSNFQIISGFFYNATHQPLNLPLIKSSRKATAQQ